MRNIGSLSLLRQPSDGVVDDGGVCRLQGTQRRHVSHSVAPLPVLEEPATDRVGRQRALTARYEQEPSHLSPRSVPFLCHVVGITVGLGGLRRIRTERRRRRS